MPNIEELKRLLREGGFTCVLSDGSELFTSRERGVKPLVGFLDSGKNFHGCFAADKIVGRAAAFLYVRLGVCVLHASVMTAGAAEICRKYKIATSSDIMTDKIINRKGDGICPMEEAVEGIDDPSAAIAAIREKLQAMTGSAA